MRSAFTMLELLLVLALAVAIAAIAMPAIEGPMQNQRLRKGADQVRAALATARNRAMKNGVTYVFRYELGGTQLFVEPWTTQADAMELPTVSSLGFGGGGTVGGAAPVSGNNAMSAGNQLASLTVTLPDRVSFQGGDVLADQRGVAMESELLNMSAGLATSSRPIFFYPDGTASDAIILVASERGHFVRVELRGLTGLTRASEVLSQSEAMP